MALQNIGLSPATCTPVFLEGIILLHGQVVLMNLVDALF